MSRRTIRANPLWRLIRCTDYHQRQKLHFTFREQQRSSSVPVLATQNISFLPCGLLPTASWDSSTSLLYRPTPTDPNTDGSCDKHYQKQTKEMAQSAFINVSKTASDLNSADLFNKGFPFAAHLRHSINIPCESLLRNKEDVNERI